LGKHSQLDQIDGVLKNFQICLKVHLLVCVCRSSQTRSKSLKNQCIVLSTGKLTKSSIMPTKRKLDDITAELPSREALGARI
jgi:hypothetical protein